MVKIISYMGDEHDVCAACGVHIDDAPGHPDSAQPGWTEATFRYCAVCGDWFCEACWEPHVRSEMPDADKE